MPQTKSIMFVDDELSVLEDIRHNMTELINNGWTSSYFTSANAALQEINRVQPDILVADLIMPEMNGDELIRIVKHRFHNVTTFIISENFVSQEAMQNYESDSKFLQKPFNPEELQAVIGRDDFVYDDFLAHMSHELRTPLNAIIGFSEILKEEHFGSLTSEKNRACARDIYDSGVFLLEVVDNILELKRQNNAQYEPNFEEVEIKKLIRECSSMLQIKIDEKKINLSHKFDDYPYFAKIDRMLIKKSVINILGNALKFTPSNGEIAISLNENKKGFEITVEDNGIGISEADLSQIIKPFVQVGRRQSKIQEGIGLGLSLTKQFVDTHGGDIEIKSNIDLGTKVTLRIPDRAPIKN